MAFHSSIETIKVKLDSSSARLEGLEDLEALLSTNSTAVLLGTTEEIFKNIRKCLTCD